jgi:hypothetical protein
VCVCVCEEREREIPLIWTSTEESYFLYQGLVLKLV